MTKPIHSQVAHIVRQHSIELSRGAILNYRVSEHNNSTVNSAYRRTMACPEVTDTNQYCDVSKSLCGYLMTLKVHRADLVIDFRLHSVSNHGLLLLRSFIKRQVFPRNDIMGDNCG
jgi:hypothetical protein